jgi:hypothetical protein
MSRKRLTPAEESFARHSLRIFRALKTGELDPLGYLILKLLVDEIEAPGSGGDAIHKLKELEELLDWPHSSEWLRKKLHTLQDGGWIDFDEPRAVREAAWIFRLRRAAIDGETDRPPTDLQLGTPSELEVTSNSAHIERRASPQPERVSRPYQPPTGSPLEKRRDKPKSQRQTLSEEKLDHVEGEATPRTPEPELEEALRPDQLEENPFPPSDGCELAACEGDERPALPSLPLFDESIGTASLDEIRRAHEEGRL